jgi:hypothetical protein
MNAMKKHVLAFGLILFLYTQTKGQFIIAGQHGSEDYYVSFNPDTMVYLDCDSSWESYIDINGDSIFVDVSGLSSGIYFVQVTTAEDRWVGRFVKE